MDYSDRPIGPSTNTVDGLLQASPDTELVASTDSSPDVIDDGRADVVDPELVPRNNSFLRLVPNLERSGAPVVSVPPSILELNSQLVLRDTQVLSLFGDVSDAEFPEVSANHPARSLQAHPNAPFSVNPQVSGGERPKHELSQPGQAARPKRSLAALSAQPFIPQVAASALVVDQPKQDLATAAVKQQAPARSRSYERRQPGSVGGVKTALARSTHPVFTSPEPASFPSNPRVSTQTNTGSTPTRHRIIDLRDAEAGLPVVTHRRTAVEAAALQNAPANYFAGHDYGQERVVSSGAVRSSQRVKRSNRNLAQQRASLGVRVMERTGLAPQVLTGLSLSVVGLSAVGLLFSPLLSLHRIDIRRAGVTAPRIRAAAQLRSGEPLISLDIEAIQRRIMALPEVSAAKVERKWPRGLQITVATRTPVVALAHAGRISLVASDGTVLRDFASGSEVVDDDGIIYQPIVTGAIAPIGEVVSGTPKRIANLVAALAPDLRDRVVSVTVNGDDLNASFSSAEKDGSLSVRFGDEHELEIKAHALGALLAAGSAATVAGIDLTVPDAPVLRLTGS